MDLRAEVVVLGAGPGGYSAAFRAADLGRQVLLVERHAALGGVCLNVGCIPSKALLHVAEVMAAARDLADAGVAFGEPKLDLSRLRAHKDAIVAHLAGGLARMAKQRGVSVLRGSGRLAGPKRLDVETESGPVVVSFEHAILAAGSRSVPLPGLPERDPRVLDSTSALELDRVPQRLLVIGGGIIGLELATVYDALGSAVSVVEMQGRLMAGPDLDLVRPLARRIEKRYAGIYTDTRVAGVEARADGLLVSFAGEKAPEPVFDCVLVAVGRRPNGDRIGAEATGLRVDERGFVPVDERLRTNLPHVHAIGDLAQPPLLAHKASHEGKVAAEVIAGLPSAFDTTAIPSVAYTDPEVAWVGLTEAEARERSVEVEVARFPWQASGRALGMGRGEGLTKLLFAKGGGRLLGAGAVGAHAGELIAECALAIEMGADAEDMARTVHPHPTLSETLGLAAEVAAGTVTDLYIPKRSR